MSQLIDFLLHTDHYLAQWVVDYGALIYLILFVVIFAETGFVVTPFLPGDGLLFTVGVVAAATSTTVVAAEAAAANPDPVGLNVWVAIIIMCIAAFLGNMVNYHIGRYLSTRVLEGGKIKYVNPEHIERTHEFFEKHGQKAVILSRFLPIFRTFVPFVAGISKMDRQKFISYTLVGGVVWVFVFTLLGYFLGSITWVKENLSMIVLGLIIVTIIPVIITALKKRPAKKKAGEV